MYRVCVAVALCTTLTAAASAWANLADTTPIFAKPIGAPRLRDNAIRLAQQDNQPVSTGNPSVAPLKWVGMLINPTPTKKDPNLVSECTGQFIRPNVVLTAGHCIKDLPDNPTGPWFDLSKQVFILQYQNGEGSQTFKTVCALTSPLWTLPANFASMSDDQQGAAMRAASEHDFAMVLVDGTSPTGTMPYLLDWKGKVTTPFGSATRSIFSTVKSSSRRTALCFSPIKFRCFRNRRRISWCTGSRSPI